MTKSELISLIEECIDERNTNNLINSIVEECNNFDSILESVDVINENAVVDTIKKIIKKIIELIDTKIIPWFKNIQNNVLIASIKNANYKKYEGKVVNDKLEYSGSNQIIKDNLSEGIPIIIPSGTFEPNDIAQLKELAEADFTNPDSIDILEKYKILGILLIEVQGESLPKALKKFDEKIKFLASYSKIMINMLGSIKAGLKSEKLFKITDESEAKEKCQLLYKVLPKLISMTNFAIKLDLEAKRVLIANSH